jgi:membrane protease YdiL (CAAX protease family)
LRRITVFLILTALLSTPFWWLSRHSGFYTAILMWCPGIAAMLTLRLTGGKLGELGWRGAKLRWVAIGAAVTAGYWVLGYGAACMLGFAGFPDMAKLTTISQGDLLFTGHSTPLAVLIVAGYAASAGVINGIGRALGEELGWRGLLVPAACSRFGFFPGAVFVGVIWAVWHWPLLYGEIPFIGIANFTLMVIGTSMPFAWLRLRSDSVWPSTVMHALHNALRSGLFAPLTFSTVPTSSLWLGETGYALAGAGALLIIGFAFLGTRNVTAQVSDA